MPLHLTKVAVGCASVEALENRIARRITQAGELRVPTRMRPKRAEELPGGSLQQERQGVIGGHPVPQGGSGQSSDKQGDQ